MFLFEKQRQRDLFPNAHNRQCPELSCSGTEARRHKLNPGLPCWGQDSNYLSPHHCLPWCKLTGNWNQESGVGVKPKDYRVRHGILISILTSRPDACPFYPFSDIYRMSPDTSLYNVQYICLQAFNISSWCKHSKSYLMFVFNSEMYTVCYL